MHISKIVSSESERVVSRPVISNEACIAPPLMGDVSESLNDVSAAARQATTSAGNIATGNVSETHR